MGKKAPKAPDPAQTAQAQAQYNQQAAGDTLKMNAMDRTNPFGSSTFTRDASGNPTGITSSLSPELAGAAGNVSGAVNAQTGLLPSGSFDPNIDAAGLRQSYVDQGLNYALPAWQQEDKLRKVTQSERGIPLGSEIYTDMESGVADNRSRYLSDLASKAWQAGANEEQRQFGNELTKYQLPGAMAGQGLGLLSGMGGLIPQAQQPQASVAAPNYTGLVQSNYQNEMQKYAADQQGLGNLLKTGAALALAPMTGGLSTTLLGTGLGALSNMWNTPSVGGDRPGIQ